MRRLHDLLLLALGLLLLVPVGGVLVSWLQWDAQSASILGQMASTVLPGYAGASLLLCLIVAVGVALGGVSTAAAVTSMSESATKSSPSNAAAAPPRRE